MVVIIFKIGNWKVGIFEKIALIIDSVTVLPGNMFIKC